jgi:hypothetical protein
MISPGGDALFCVVCKVPFKPAEDADEICASVHPAVVRGLEADNLPWLVQLCDM